MALYTVGPVTAKHIISSADIDQYHDLLTGAMTDQPVAIGNSISSLGLSGATAASRYVGATASGPPTSGTFQQGDFVIDRLGCLHVCQGAGTPGTWSSPPMGTLGYAQITADQTGITGMTDISGLSVTVSVGTGRRIRVSAFCAAIEDTNFTDVAQLCLSDTSNIIARASTATGSPYGQGLTVARVYKPGGGSRTYKVQLDRKIGTDPMTFQAGSDYPAYIHVEDVGT